MLFQLFNNHRFINEGNIL